MSCSTYVKVTFLSGKMGIIIQEPLFNIVVRLEILYTIGPIWRRVSTVNKRHKRPCFKPHQNLVALIGLRRLAGIYLEA